MRVLLITPDAGGRTKEKAPCGAVAPYSRSLVERLQPLVDLTVCEDGNRRETIARNGVRIERMPLTGLKGLWNMLRCVAAARPDVVHVQHEMYLYGGIATILVFPWMIALMSFVAPVVVTLHHTVSQNSIGSQFQKLHLVRIPLFFLRWGMRYFYGAMRLTRSDMVVHHAMFADILSHEYGFSNRRVHVISHGHADVSTHEGSASDARGEFGIPEDTTAFGFFGYIDPRKNIEFMIEEFRTFSGTHPSCMLVIAGDLHPRLSGQPKYHEYIRRLQDLAQSCGERVRWQGYITDHQIPRFLRSIDCLILPYDCIPGASSVLSLAIGAEKPFLVSESLGAIAEEGCFQFAFRPGALERALDEFVTSNPSEDSHIPSHVERIKEKASWATCASLTADLYEHVRAERKERSSPGPAPLARGNLTEELLPK